MDANVDGVTSQKTELEGYLKDRKPEIEKQISI